LYGGRDPIKSVEYDDVYVLSLPAFNWTQVNFGQSPRWGHDCHVVGNRQMLTIGGNTTNEQCDWEIKGVAILDMSTITWGSVYNAYAPEYLVPTPIVDWLGGSPSGGATIKSPVLGYNQTGLAEVFNTTRAQPSPSATPSQSPVGAPGHKSHAGAIAGGVIGGVAALAILAGLLLWLRARKRRKDMEPRELDGAEKRELQNADLQSPPKHHHELPATLEKPVELAEQHGASEAPRETFTEAAELSGTNIVPGGMHGVPMIRTPSTEESHYPFAKDPALR
jgi:hypothetical protein